MRRVEVSRQVPAGPQPVWDLLSDHAGLSSWAGLTEVVLRQQGFPPPNGLGAIRVVRSMGLAMEEEVTAFEPPKRMAYRLTAGAPMRDHHGCIDLEPCDGGTRVTWSVEFRPWVPGTGALLAWTVERSLRGVLDRHAAYPFSSASE